MPNPKDIRLYTQHETIYLSDREGDVACQKTRAAHWYEASGFSLEDAESIAQKHATFFEDEACFLVGRKDPTTGHYEMGFVVEFEIDEDLVPQVEPKDLSAHQKKAWSDFFELFAPAIAHVVTGLENIRKSDEPEMACHMDLSYLSVTAIGVFIPLSCAHHYRAVFELLFLNGLPFPASNHLRIAALQKLRWVYTAGELDPSILPPTGAPAVPEMVPSS